MKEVNKGILIIAGDGPLKNKVIEHQNKYNNIRYVGYADRKMVKYLLGICSFSIVPSEWYENSPIAVLESFANKKPVIGTNLGGLKELIKDGNNGLLFERGSEKELAIKINYLSSNIKYCMCLGDNAYISAEKQYTKRKHIDEIMSIYSKIVENGH
jgi:glycosyltransferase involved in cell wall biosynthesis